MKALYLLLATLSLVVLYMAVPTWIIKSIYDLFILELPFWSTMIYNAVGLVVAGFVSFIVFIITYQLGGGNE